MHDRIALFPCNQLSCCFKECNYNRLMSESPAPPALEEFLASIQGFSIQEKFYKWESYLLALKNSESQYYQAILERFVEYFPFNHSRWSEICDIAIRVPKTGKANAVRLYQLALNKNPRSISLWHSYLQWLGKEICKSDPGYLRKQFDRAIKIIGNHYKAAFIFEGFLEVEPSPIKKFQAIKKALVSPLQEIDRIYDLAETYVQTSEELSFDVLRQLAADEALTPIESSPEGYMREVRGLLRAQLRKLYEPTKRHVELRYEFESKLSALDEYKPFNGNIELWRNYLSFMRQSGNPDFLCPLYQRALITNCDSQSLWEEYFLHLEADPEYHNRALYLLRSHATFFRNFSREITYYWVQLEEKENHVRSRELYLQLQRSDPHLDVFLRHIQMEIRYKEFLNARVLYETILTTFTTNTNIIAFVVIEYAELALKYFRDIDVRKVLRSYFDSFPFSQRLLFSLLEFYIKYVEFRETRDNEIYEQFLGIAVDGLRRALQNNPQEYRQIGKIVRKYLRDYVPSIYLLKKAEKKIREMEMAVRRGEESGKRVLGEQERVGFEQRKVYTPYKRTQ